MLRLYDSYRSRIPVEMPSKDRDMAGKNSLTKLERAAYHEAGHAVVSYLVHRRLACVSIIPNPVGHCEYRNLATFKSHALLTSRLRAQVEKLIMVLLAGAITEHLKTGRIFRKGSDEDIKQAHDAAMYLIDDDKEAKSFVDWLWEHTGNILSYEPHWAAVEALAQELMERRFIGERLARRIIRSSIDS
jgi:hypothetical protein